MRRILLLSFIFCIVGISTAQNRRDKDKKRQIHRVKKTQFGIRSGLNYSMTIGNDIIGNESRIAYHLGAYVQFPLSKKNKDLLIETGLFYSHKGWDLGYIVPDKMNEYMGAVTGLNKLEYGQSSAKMEFLDIPIVLKDNQSEKFVPFGGLEFSTLLKTDFEYGYKYVGEDGKEVFKTERTQPKDNLQTLFIGVIMGMEYHVNHFLNLNASFNYPLTNLDNKGFSDIKILNLKLAVGFTF